MTIESRVEKLEKHIGAESGGREWVIKYCNGEVVCLRDGDGPPWQTLTLEVVFDQTEEEQKEFTRMMQSLFNGEGPRGNDVTGDSDAKDQA
jgi:hypothetical protein